MKKNTLINRIGILKSVGAAAICITIWGCGYKFSSNKTLCIAEPATYPGQSSFHKTISAEQLLQYYSENQELADKNFKDKRVNVNGTISGISQDMMGDLYVTLESASLFREVVCYFDNKTTAIRLRKGMHVEVSGNCDGRILDIQLSKCTLLNSVKF